MEIVRCPDGACAAPAEVIDRWTWPSTDGPLEHLRTRCLHGHGYTVRVEPQTLEDVLAEILHSAA